MLVVQSRRLQMSDRENRTTIKVVPATKARIHFGEMLKRVYTGGEHLIIEQDGLPVAILLSHAEYEQLRRAAALRELEELNQSVNRGMQAKGIIEERALADLRRIKQAVVGEKYGRTLRTRKRKKLGQE
jgi:prevent-host-death family protein